MATSKTLKPTNQTISIPAMTDRPNQAVNSNCIEKLADAVNAIEDRTAGMEVFKSTYNQGSSKQITVPTGKSALIFYAGHMSSVFNAETQQSTIYSGGDSFSDAGFTVSKSGDTYTFTRTNGNPFQFGYIIV